LVGIIVNNAIVLIDKINANREKWVPGDIAVIEAGKSRLRSIVISTIATIAWIGTIVFQDEFWMGLGVTVIAGLLVCTILTLYVIPSLYYEFFLKPSDEKTMRKRLTKYILQPTKQKIWQIASSAWSQLNARLVWWRSKK
jgi:HAE1 family hydrophobic/amphiphilic exporter-1